MTDKPQFLVVGGPNGSGKTTVALQYAAARAVPYIGADMIAASLNRDDPTSVRVKAGRQFIRAIDESIRKRQSVVVESTRSGRSFRKILLNAGQRDFEITIVFVFVDSADVCVSRVAQRVRKGGMTFRNRISAAATSEASAIFGQFIVIWPINGSHRTMVGVVFKMCRLDRDNN